MSGLAISFPSAVPHELERSNLAKCSLAKWEKPLSNNNIVPLRPKPLDVLCEAHPGIEHTSTAATVVPSSATLSSTIAFTGRTNLTVTPDDWRKPQRRKVYAALDARFPCGLPIEMQMKAIISEIRTYALEQGWPEPKDKTIQRAIRDRYPALTVGST
jgi:hypothetical protein